MAAKVWATHLLTELQLSQALAAGADSIICNELSPELSLPEGLRLINAETYRVAGTRMAYARNRKVLQNLLRGRASAFRIRGTDLGPALAKTLYWTNYKTGYLEAAFSALPEPKICLNGPLYPHSGRLREIVKYLFLWMRNNLRAIGRQNRPGKAIGGFQTGILVNDEFEFRLFLPLIQRLSGKACLLIHYGNIPGPVLAMLPDSCAGLDIGAISDAAPQALLNPFRLPADQLNALNAISGKWPHFSNELAAYRLIKACGLKKLLVNVAENIASRNLMRPVFCGKPEVYNAMNGLKSGEAQDADITFEHWFVWDDAMKKRMTEHDAIPAGKLIVAGHLSEDRIAEWTYGHSLPLSPESLQGKKVISFFTVRGQRREKQDLFRMLYPFMQTSPDCFLIVRPHPLEAPSDYILPPAGTDNVFFVPDALKNSKETLYDQLLLSDLSIVIGSTVALESRWMGVPCLSFEYKKESLIYPDGSGSVISHIQTGEELLGRLSSLQKRRPSPSLQKNRVADLMAAALR